MGIWGQESGEMMTLTLDQVRKLALSALIAAGTSSKNAGPVAESIVEAEADGLRAIGLGYLPTYCEHLLCGKVDGQVAPQISDVAPAALLVDAGTGFAHPAIALGRPLLAEKVRQNGIAVMSIYNSYACGVLGHLVEPLAREGLLSLVFANAPANIAPWGGRKPLFGTNPFALAAPRENGHPMIIDQATSVVTKVALLRRAAQGLPLPEGWALDDQGHPTTDAQAGLKGSMSPAGGYKGANLAIMVELMAAVMTGAVSSWATTSFGNNEGGPPKVGQLFIAINPGLLSRNTYFERVEELAREILNQQGTMLPGDDRLAERRRSIVEGVTIDCSLHEKIQSYAIEKGNDE